MDYGIRISRDGYDVKSGTDKQMSLTSKYKTFKVVASGTQNVGLSTGWYRNRGEITHGLGYVPAFIVFGKESGESTWKKVPYTPAVSDIGYYFLYAWADSNKIYFEAQFGYGAPSDKTYNFKYYIFDNQLE